MTPYEPTWKERLEEAKPYVMPAVAGFIALGVAGWVVWHQWVAAPAPKRAAVAGVAFGRGALERSVVLEEEALAAQRAGQTAGVADRLREALQLQREANASPTAAKDLPREARLMQALAAAEAEPLRVAKENALSLARAAVAQEHWDDALRNYGEARAAQAEINQKLPGTRYANPAGLAEIEGEIASLQASGLSATISAREREGDVAATAGRSQEAAASYAAAIEIQRQVNENFSRSRFASTARWGELNAKRDTVLSAALLARARILDGEIAAALGRRQTVAAREKIAEAAALVAKSAADFPRSREMDRVLPARLGFLSALGGDLEALQRECFERLAAVPGSPGVQMLKTEVTQDLYGRVMNANPSRNAGRSLPVDSVSWVEVREFCQRLSWTLGVRVRPPSEAEMRAAFEPVKEVWSAETSGGHSHEVGKFAATSQGFHDLAGNLAEWLQPSDDASGTAPVAGGSYLDSTRSLATLAIVPLAKPERARHIGFRFVVERAPR